MKGRKKTTELDGFSEKTKADDGKSFKDWGWSHYRILGKVLGRDERVGEGNSSELGGGRGCRERDRKREG